MKKTTFLMTTLASALVLSGCIQTKPCCDKPANEAGQPQADAVHQVIYQTLHQPEEAKTEAATEEKKAPELMKITGIGYGAESTFAAYTPGQRRLMAIRSAKLDAYRALAEQLYGIRIDSNTSVATLTAKNDSFRARVNAVVRGARVVSVTPMADNNYETVLEVYVDKKFFEEAFIYTGTQNIANDPDSVYKVSSY
ncbi:LPP20 family lipoprotein [Thiomicrorhabdus sediminis]|uniref:Lipoprotein LPP20-like domain-containing protein n=1 Tax=Thiomicrorhabdus sediminis TaxID=2580412 RepID=A0A4P9K7R1_9GAMM|nr:LPP20 family lipoprotein [Thiomicrorhabdus sediminis]QCU90500.1 hypothetical protein FE785_07565 [Thiomicrorhabdus sediminis]